MFLMCKIVLCIVLVSRDKEQKVARLQRQIHKSEKFEKIISFIIIPLFFIANIKSMFKFITYRIYN